MKILILTAGYATRLYPLTIDTPKPLLEVGGMKMIDRILEKTARFVKESDSICVVTNGKFFNNFDEWCRASDCMEKICIINDRTTSNETRLGAIRDIELAIKEKNIDDDILIVAGDNLFELDIGKFLEFAKEKTDGVSVALHDIKDIGAAKRYGVVTIDAHHKVTEFEEKPEHPKSTLVSTGIYFIPKEKLGSLKEYIRTQAHKSDAPGYYISWLSKNDKVYGFAFDEDWYDIGDIESYKKADQEYHKKER
jgi:glucose-1-phosphate thymidylyltransferase